jgi:hypothetical protein
MFFESGGAVYHLRGARSASKLWKPTRQWLSEKLNQWSPAETELILVGPSAGYLFETAPLKRWKKIIAVDRDPWSHILFRLRHPTLSVKWIQQDLNPFATETTQGATKRENAIEPLRKILDSHPQAAILFANCLGQLWLEDSQWAKEFFAELPGLLRQRSVLSVHDRLSFKSKRSVSGEKALGLNKRPQPDQLLKLIFEENDWRGVTVTDHEVPAEAIFPSTASWSYKVWSVTPQQHHVLEAIYR